MSIIRKLIPSEIFSSELNRRFASGAFWSIIAAAITRGITLFTFIVLARIIGREGYGQIGIIQNTLGSIALIAGLGLGTSATKYVAHYRDIDVIRTARIIKLTIFLAKYIALLASIVTMSLSSLIATRMLSDANLSWALVIGSAMVLSSVMNSVVTGALSGLEAFKILARLNFITGLVSLPLIIFFAKLLGVVGAILGLTASNAIACLINRYALDRECLKRSIPILPKVSWEERSIIWNFTLPAAISGIIVSPIIWYANILLVRAPDGYSQMGIFAAAQQWQMAITFLPLSLSPVLLTLLSNIFQKGDGYNYKKMLSLSFLSCGLIAAMGTFFVIMLSSVILRCYGSDFINGGRVLTLMAFSALLISLSNVVGQEIASSSSMWVGLFFNVMWALIFLITAQAWVKTKGAIGLAESYMVSYSFHFLFLMIYLFWSLSKRKDGILLS